MKRLGEFTLGPRGEWWVFTLLIVIPFGSFGVLFGYSYVYPVLGGDLLTPGLTTLGYVIVITPGITSAACFGTILMRVFGKPGIWLGCLSVALILLCILFPVAPLYIAVIMVLWPDFWPFIVAALAFVAAVVGLTIYSVWPWPRDDA